MPFHDFRSRSRLTHTNLGSMRLINVKAFMKREQVMSNGGAVNRQTKVLEFADDEATLYSILSHRWTGQEVNYEEIVDLAKMEKDERNEVRRRLGYQKILASCEQAKKDEFEWLWVDTCCIDKRSSAELSEAINSMYRWYENSGVCYAYLHDVPSSLPRRTSEMYPNSEGWPEWFSRGWTLQEMIAPCNVQFFNKGWEPIGNKKMLAHTLSRITGVPPHILANGLSASNRPCVAQIISWAANRTTTRVEDKAYSLLGLLDINMPMLYGEGRKAFHRLQLEIIRASNDQSIFAWGCDVGLNGRTGSVLADDPSFFWGCDKMELMDWNTFIQSLEDGIPDEALRSIEEDRFGIFPITNRGIQFWLPVRPYADSGSLFEAWLPCRHSPTSGKPVSITLASWKSDYYRYFVSPPSPTGKTLQFRQLYLRYQDTPHRDTTFEIDDTAITENSFTHCTTYPLELTGNTLTLADTRPLCVRVYSDGQANCYFAAALGQCFGQDWIHLACASASGGHSWEDYARKEYRKMLINGPEHAQSLAEARRSSGERGERVWIIQTHLPGSTWTLRTSYVVWQSSRIGVRFEVFRYPGFSNVSSKWTDLPIDVCRWNLVHTHSLISVDIPFLENERRQS